MRPLFRPALALLGRLRFAQKFVLLGLVLVVPLGVVSVAYIDVQNTSVSSTAVEQSGMRAIEPLLRVGEDVAAARHVAATTGASAAVPAVDIAAVDAAQRRYGATLGTAAAWTELRQQLMLAGTTSGRATALAAYDGASIAVQDLLISIGDASDLSVDPDLAVSDLFDSVDGRIPLLLDSSTRIVDQLSSQPGRALTANARVGVLSAVGVSLGTIESTATALDQAIGNALQLTGRGSLRAPLAQLDGAVSLLDQALRDVELFHASLGSSGVSGGHVVTGAHRLMTVATRVIDRLLQARIARDTARAQLVEILAATMSLMAIYLFSAFYFGFAGGIRSMVTTLRAFAEGRLTDQVVITSRDELGYVAAAINDMVGKVRHATAELAHEAAHDSLTGLPNRAYIVEQLERSLSRASLENSLALLFVDLDGFKSINDSMGHRTGDCVLREVSTRLLGITRPPDIVARLSGDEFLIVCERLPDALDAVAVARRVLQAVASPIVVHTDTEERREVCIGASIGVAFVTGPQAGADALIGDADVAMYRAKQLGRGRIEIFDDGLRADLEDRQRLRDELRTAIAEGQIRVHYQPIVDIHSGEVRGFEALARWEHPERGLLGPGAFMPAAESSGLIIPLGADVLRQACRQLAAWHRDPSTPPGLHMAVNLSVRQLVDREIVDVVAAAIAESGINPEHLWLEITESALLTDADTAKEVLLTLRASGVRLVLDDFGTGYSSLQHLKLFPLDAIKIDRSFVAGLGTDEGAGDRAIIRSVVWLADALGFAVVGEGVETAQQREMLIEMGCGLAQGYLFARPRPAADIAIAAPPPPVIAGAPGAGSAADRAPTGVRAAGRA
jgi:diguanylate cyclase (GGDEF)-like protein